MVRYPVLRGGGCSPSLQLPHHDFPTLRCVTGKRGSLYCIAVHSSLQSTLAPGLPDCIAHCPLLDWALTLALTRQGQPPGCSKRFLHLSRV